MGIATSENALSRLYTFYLDPTSTHGLGNNILQTLLNEAGIDKDFLGNINRIEREYHTSKTRRVDIAIFGDKGILLIENKVYHFLGDHQLKYYVEDIKLETTLPVTLIVMGLHPIAKTETFADVKFISHGKFVERVQQNKYFAKTLEPYKTFWTNLNDHIKHAFYKTIDPTSINYIMQRSAEVQTILDANHALKLQILNWFSESVPPGFAIKSKDYENYYVRNTSPLRAYGYI